MVRNWLEIQESNEQTINILEPFTFEGNLAKNTVWYRGDAAELHQFYTQIDDKMGNTSFWAAKPSKGLDIRKIHTGLPNLIIKMLTKVVVNTLDSIDILSDQKDDDGNLKKHDKQEVWDNIAKENKFKKVVKKSVTKALALGDGAFKISYDTDISKLPIIEFYGTDRVEFKYNRGRIVEIVFKTKKRINDKTYLLKDHYTKKGITYTLEDCDGKIVSLDAFEETRDLMKSTVTNPNGIDLMMAIPFMIEESSKYEGRGKSIIDGREGAFDSFDEVWSQWVEAVRKGRVKRYIPESLIPQDPTTGEYMKPNSFDNDFIKVATQAKEEDKNEITTNQPEIRAEELQKTYVTALDLCLQGLISPSTIGIDSKKLDNAEAQREKEKATLYTRDEIVDVLQEVLKEVVNTALKVYDIAQNTVNIDNAIEIVDYNVDVQFGEYANPSFEAQVETIGKASTSHVMSTESQVEELWGDTKDDKWKKEEVKRLKEEKGIAEMPIPSVGLDNNKSLEDINE